MGNIEDITGKINLILLNMPRDLSELYQLRYIYIMLGRVFSYDLSTIAGNYQQKELDYDNISEYQTCIQITEILDVVLKDINPSDPNLKTKIVPMPSTNPRYSHLANEIEFTDSKSHENYHLLLDLTMDLYKIQAGMRTTEFGFRKYDVIPQSECEKMDREMNLIGPEGYQDEKIEKVRQELQNGSDSLENKIRKMWQKLQVNFKGSNEATLYFRYLLKNVFKNEYTGVSTIDFTDYNIYYKNNLNFQSIFIIKENEGYSKDEKKEPIYVLFDNTTGFIISKKENIIAMLNSGWKNNGELLYKELGINKKEKAR